MDSQGREGVICEVAAYRTEGKTYCTALPQTEFPKDLLRITRIPAPLEHHPSTSPWISAGLSAWGVVEAIGTRGRVHTEHTGW